MYLLRSREGPALRGSPFPVFAVTASAVAHALAAGALMILADLQWNSSKVYVVNLVPAVSAVGSPVGRTPAPTLPRRPVLSNARPAPETIPQTLPESQLPETPLPERPTPERPALLPKPTVEPTRPAPAPKLPEASLPRPTAKPAARPPVRPRPGEVEPTLRLPERRSAARPALPRAGQKELPTLSATDGRRPVPDPPPRVTEPERPAVARPAIAPMPLGRPDGSTAGVASLSLDVSNFPFTYYLRQIEKKVSEKWVPPAQADAPVQRVVVLFEIARTGDVAQPEVEKSSGNAWYDQSALRAVIDATPFPPLPQQFPGDSLRVHFGFEFVQDRR